MRGTRKGFLAAVVVHRMVPQNMYRGVGGGRSCSYSRLIFLQLSVVACNPHMIIRVQNWFNSVKFFTNPNQVTCKNRLSN